MGTDYASVEFQLYSGPPEATSFYNSKFRYIVTINYYRAVPHNTELYVRRQ
jgi:hypothetical protein